VDHAADEKTWQRAVHNGAFGASFFLSASDVEMLARGETDTPKPMPTGSVTLMLEIHPESNAGRINSGSTRKSVKAQAFYSEVIPASSSFGRVARPVFFPVPDQWAPLTRTGASKVWEPMRHFTRRELLQLGTAAAAAELASPVGQLLPFHLDTTKANAACTHDISRFV
jgi:hypothetical protein